ncbi:hypothetical protein MHU86_13189 [Fragilaria crotonensis]|nr:hypothetical protein MHU86_13189 [Fragilaria crotonensis]
MKVITLFVASLATAAAFAPAQNGRVQSVLSAEKKPFFSQIFDLDLFAPVATQNDYGARTKKNVQIGKITEKSYIPAGLSAAEYQKIREAEKKKKDSIYQKNVAKAGKFQDFTKFYIQRGTDTDDKWVKSVTRGHTMAKTKYDFSGAKDENKKFEAFIKK